MTLPIIRIVNLIRTKNEQSWNKVSRLIKRFLAKNGVSFLTFSAGTEKKVNQCQMAKNHSILE